MRSIKPWLWPALCFTLVVGWAWTLTIKEALQEQNALLKQVVQIQNEWCGGLGKVNALCEESMIDLATRLGLDQDYLPLVTTALWRRSMEPTVTKARRMLGAPSVSSGMLDDAKSGIGGGEDDIVPPKSRVWRP